MHLSENIEALTAEEAVSTQTKAMERAFIVFLQNAIGVARRRLNVQSEANDRRYPPLPPLTCCASVIFFLVRNEDFGDGAVLP